MISFHTKLLLTFRCARVALWPAIFLNVGIVTFSGTTASLYQATLAAFALCCVASYGFLINDCKDIEVDRINHSHRLENATNNELAFIRVASVILLSTALVSSIGLGWKGLACMGVIGVGLTVYTFYARQRLIVATILAAFLASSPLWAPSFVFSSQLTLLHIGIIAAVVALLMGREIIFDVADVRGDSNCQRRTFATVFNRQLAVDVSITLNVLGAFLLALLLIFRHQAPLTFIAWVAIALLLWLLLPPILKLRSDPGSVLQVEAYSERSRLAMLLLPVLWLCC